VCGELLILGKSVIRHTQALGHAQTIPRVGKPEDIANMVWFLAGDESQWVTGQAIIVDGGLSVGPIPAPSIAAQQTIPIGFSGPSFKR